ncbi:MAG: hypothetical protein CMB80_10680 [Flammeovirgaceae bacterium]|nr:hypothetical protein [Flammeovirgaceae bacterium]
MTPTPAITELFSLFLNSGGQPKVTEFKKYLNDVINSDIKPLCTRSGKSAEAGGWREELKTRFSGRGAKWVKLDNSYIEPSLTILEEDEDVDCSEYRFFTQAAGYSWIRFAGPRIDNNNQAAAFEIRTNGSKLDHPSQLFYIDVEHLDSIIQPLGGTPHSLGLETVNDAAVTVKPVTETEVTETAVAEEPEPEVAIEDEAPKNMPPTSADPAEWEAFLEAEGLGAELSDEADVDIFEEI